MDPFIHLLGSSLIQWMISRINGREKTKHNLQVRLGMRGSPRKSIAMPRRIRKSDIQASGSPRHGFLRQGGDLCLGKHSYA